MSIKLLPPPHLHEKRAQCFWKLHQAVLAEIAAFLHMASKKACVHVLTKSSPIIYPAGRKAQQVMSQLFVRVEVPMCFEIVACLA